jgi:TolB-like protein
LTSASNPVGESIGGHQQAVFLSYASEDAAAAQRICTALRAAGIEVWFDQNALRGGDAWDATIRNQIKNCVLFIPVISNNTRIRDEGYFRLEWKLAVDRSHLMATDKTFLLPVVIDDTHDADARVPDRFREIHWTRLPDGSAPYAFAERVSQLLATTSSVTQPPERTSASSSPAVRPRGFSARTQATALVVVLVVIAITGSAIAWYTRSARIGNAASMSGPTAASASPEHRTGLENSIAVLPFIDMSEQKDQEYFSDGLAEELLDQLTKIPGLHVIARTSSFSFKDKNEDIPTIAKKLNVNNILEGSVRKSGNRLRVTTQLIRADSGEDLWSETYDRQLKDVFQVQDEIANAVVTALKLKLAPGEQRSMAHRTSSVEAYNQFLLGRQFYARSRLEDLGRAAAAYRSATDLDPHFAAAYAELAVVMATLSDRSMDPAEFTQALALAEKAVALAPDEADGYAVRGFLRRYSWDWTGARSDLDKALSIDPGDSTVQLRYSSLMASLNRGAEAIAAGKRATDLDPLSTLAWVSLAQRYIVARQFAAAHDALNRALNIQPDSTYSLYALGTLKLLENNAADALTTFRQINDDVSRVIGIAMAEHMLYHPNESKLALDSLIAKYAHGAAYQIAQIYAWRGEKDNALDWLQRAYQQRDGGLQQIKGDVFLASLRSDERFIAILKGMKLPE